MNLEELRIDCSLKQKKGLHFILASVIIWIAVFFIHNSTLPILTKNLLTFCFTAPLLPIAYFISKLIKVDFQNENNPLNNLGVLFSLNQMLYLLIAMWIYPTIPEKMIMVIAIIFGAHLLPYGWLYQSKSYYVFSALIPLSALYIGTNFAPDKLALFMIGIEVIFSIMLILENSKLAKSKINQ